MSGITWQHARAIHGLNLRNVVAEVYKTGQLKPYLDAEVDSWASSQKADLERLRDEISLDFDSVMHKLDQQVKGLAPASLAQPPGVKEKLNEMAASERNRLSTLEAEVSAHFSKEIGGALAQCKDDYKKYEASLQEVIFQTLEQRHRNANIMRQLKISLCRWRLDYQRAYHDQVAKLANQANDDSNSRASDVSAAKMSEKYNQERSQMRNVQTKRMMEKLRLEVVKLWEQGGIPVSEIHKFLGRVTDTVARDGLAEPILHVYQEELKRYGALPVLESASQPDVMQCFLESLMGTQKDSRGGRDSSIMNRGSIM